MALETKHKVGIGCLGVTVLLCVGFGVLLKVASDAVGALEGANVACEGKPVEGASAYEPGGAQRVTSFVHQESGGWAYSGLMPRTFPDAEEASEASLVFCIEPEVEREVESCAYEGGVVVRRMGYVRPIRVVAAATGETIREQEVEGPAAAECPEQVATGGGGGGVSIRLVGIPVATVGEEKELPPERVQQGEPVNALAIEAAFRDVVLPE